jgi:SAM-dependent methyltransferase
MNRDDAVVDDFGDEWARFDQGAVADTDLEPIFDSYFAHFPWADLPSDAVGVDVGCGSGRWADFVASRVGRLICVDASAQAVEVARTKLARHGNCEVIQASVDEMPIDPGSVDFVYSLGVLHHVPDTQAAIDDCVALLKPGGIFYVYLYYSFENRPAWFRALWRTSEVGRNLVSRSPRPVKNAVCEVIAVLVYWPLARLSRLLERMGASVARMPLSSYRSMSLYSMRTDARDRFGTRLEKRFSRAQIAQMLGAAGLVSIDVPDTFPFWMAIGRKHA